MTKATIVQIISQTLSFIKDINYKTQEVEFLNSPTYYVNYNLYACIFKTKALLCFLIREPYRFVYTDVLWLGSILSQFYSQQISLAKEIDSIIKL